MRQKQFSCFSSQNFFGFWVEIFWDFRPKNFKNSSKLPSACTDEQFLAWRNFQSFESFWIFYRNLRHGSQKSIYVSRVKIALEKVFLFFFSDFFRILSERFLRLSAKKLHEVVKTTFCVSRGTLCDFNFFSKVFNRFEFPAETFGMVLKNQFFFVFLTRIFSTFLSKIFLRLSAKKLQQFVKTNFCVSTGTTCGFNFFLKVLNHFGFSTETFGMFLKVLSTCPE